MNRIYPLLLLIALLSFTSRANCQESGDMRISDAASYLGQAYPGFTPKIFAKDYLNKDCGIYANVSFQPDLTTVCWTPNSSNDSIYRMGLFIGEKKDHQWLPYQEIRFLDSLHGHRSPYFSLDGKRLYFQGYLTSNEGWDQFERFYYVKMKGDAWSDPVLLDTLFNKYTVHWQFSLDRQNNLYFSGDLRGIENTGGIYCSSYEKGSFIEPVLLFSNQDYGDAVFGPAVSPSADYLLFARIHPRGSTNPRIFSIYVSFRNDESYWEKPMDLGGLLLMDANQPRISPDGKYIFFVGNDGFSYWVDSRILEGM
ncbi:MAG: hypothetical protein DRI97_09860 [Bacteroidetes bacterium]|nr:MAG: hypothetical protein DRI97_09860 [Bacteroidota bacterium]RLD93410.1 MAG: hypothetical protein DRJ29_08945 [Bacteroidota bacterium]RLE00808.1 MAG: hypothetical protein DRJ13_07920 [Bacteroidota bacterium]